MPIKRDPSIDPLDRVLWQQEIDRQWKKGSRLRLRALRGVQSLLGISGWIPVATFQSVNISWIDLVVAICGLKFAAACMELDVRVS